MTNRLYPPHGMQNSITLKGKNKERSVPMVRPLRDALANEMQNRIKDGTFDIDDLVVHYISDTVTKKIKSALKSNLKSFKRLKISYWNLRSTVR